MMDCESDNKEDDFVNYKKEDDIEVEKLTAKETKGITLNENVEGKETRGSTTGDHDRVKVQEDKTEESDDEENKDGQKKEREVLQQVKKEIKTQDKKNKPTLNDNKITEDKGQTEIPKPATKKKRKNSAFETDTVAEIEDDVLEDEDEDTEMTEEEKEDMYTAARNGQYVELQNCLEKKNADINMTWYKENLLMVALRSNELVICEFLIDNGINYNYTITLLDLHKNKSRRRFQQYELSCRQLAYDLGHLNIVELIDVKNGCLHKYYKPTSRIPRIMRPPAPPVPKRPWEEEEEEEDMLSDEEEMWGTTQQETSRSALIQSSSARTRIDSEYFFTDPNFSTLPDVRDEVCGFISPVSPVPSPVKSLRNLNEDRPGLLRRGTRSSLTREIFNSSKYIPDFPKSADYINTLRRNAKLSKETLTQKRKPLNGRDPNLDVTSLSFTSSVRPPSPVITHAHHSHRKVFKPRPHSSPASPVAQITKILNQSKLLSNKTVEPALPYIMRDVKRQMNSNIVTPWCHGNSSGVFEKLSNSKIHNIVMHESVNVDRQLYSRRHWSARR